MSLFIINKLSPSRDGKQRMFSRSCNESSRSLSSEEVLPGMLPRSQSTPNDLNSGEGDILQQNDIYNSCNGTSAFPATKVFKRRFWILFVFVFMSWFSMFQWYCWGPISASMRAAFPGWDAKTISMLENWFTITFVICVAPVCWGIQRFGLRKGMISSSLLMTAALVLRCISDKTPLFTYMCHLSAILIGICSVILFAAPTMLVAVWFPFSERTTATAIIMAGYHLGYVGCYLEPFLVPQPGPGISNDEIRNYTMILMYIFAGVGALISLCILIYFPSAPPLPPSLASTERRLNFKDGLLAVFGNRSVVILIISYGIACGPSIAWLGLLNFSLEPLGIDQNEAVVVGQISVFSCVFCTIVVGRFTDCLFGRLRQTAIVLLLLSAISYYWFLLIVEGYIPISKWQVTTSVALGLGLNYAALPLFYELASEMAYPASEVVVGGIVTASDSLAITFFLFIYLIKDIGVGWVPYAMIFTITLTVIPLLFVKVRYIRSNIDTAARNALSVEA